MANKTSPGAKAQYTAYKAKNSASVNKTRKLLKHLKNHPNDAQAAVAAKKGVGYARKNPGSKNGWVTESVRGFVQNFAMHFKFGAIKYKDLPTMGRYNSMKVAAVIKKCAKVRNTYTYPVKATTENSANF